MGFCSRPLDVWSSSVATVIWDRSTLSKSSRLCSGGFRCPALVGSCRGRRLGLERLGAQIQSFRSLLHPCYHWKVQNIIERKLQACSHHLVQAFQLCLQIQCFVASCISADQSDDEVCPLCPPSTALYLREKSIVHSYGQIIYQLVGLLFVSGSMNSSCLLPECN